MSDLSSLSDAELTSLYQRTKDPFSAALSAEGATGPLAEIARSIYAQESASGKNTKTSNRGAVGGMQIRPGTFQRVADKGWDIKDPYDNARAGIRYLSQLFEKSGGDPELTAVGYYGGPGAIDKAKNGIAVSDPMNPDAPDTLQYGKQVAERMKKGGFSGVLDKMADAVIPSANAETVKDSPYSKMSDEELIAAYAAAKKKAPTEAQKPEKRSLVDELGHQAGLTLRAGVNGLASVPAMMSDAVTGPINAGLDAVAGKGNGFRFQRASDALNNIMDAAGVAKPENATERVVQDAASAVAGAGSMVGAGKLLASAGGATAKGVGDLLASGPGLQTTSAATGAGASGIVRENGGSEGAQIAAGLAGSLAPSVVPTLGKAAVRGVLRGGEQGRLTAEKNLAAFEAAGTTPTLGQATGGRMAQATEALLAKTPGGAGVIAKKAQQQADDVAASVQRLSEELAPNANSTNAGEAIERGIAKYKESSKLVQQQLYAKLDKYIPPETPITSERTAAALADLNADIAGAPELSKWFKNAKIQGIEGGLKSDTGSIEAVLSRPGMKEQAENLRTQLENSAARTAAMNAERQRLGMKNLAPEMTPEDIANKVNSFLAGKIDNRLPYESVKKLRTLVGKELSDSSIVSDVPRSKWTALYSALSDDLGVAAQNAGKEAETAWSRANQFTKRQMDRLESLKGVFNKDTPEKVFNAAISGSAEGATTINRVINVIPVSERREVAAAVLQRMGRATAGQQNALGDAFSTETFLSNLSKFSPEARQAIFGRTGVKGIEEKLGIFAKVAEIRREGGKVFANPSGTAPAVAQGAIGGGVVYGIGSALAGNPLPLAAAAAAPAAAYSAAKYLTNPVRAQIAATRTPILDGTQAAIVGSTTRLNSQGHPVDPRTIPVSQRQPEPPRVELRGMAQPESNGIDAIADATNVDDAIRAAHSAVRSNRPPLNSFYR